MFTKLTCMFAVVLATGGAAFAEAEASAEEIANTQGIFSGSLADAAWTVIAFVLLLVLLRVLAWKPMLAGLKNRQEHIAQQIEGAESARKQAEKTLADYNKRIDEIEAKGQEILKGVTSDAEEQRRQIEDRTRRESAMIKAKAQEDIAQARDTASEQIWNEVGDVVLALGSEVLGRRLTKEDNDRLIAEAIGRLKQQKQVAKGTA